MKNLIILDVDITFRSLYKGDPGRWRSKEDGFTSVEYFYAADDAATAALIGKNVFFSTGYDDTVLNELERTGLMPFAARGSGSRSFSGRELAASGKEDDQPSRIKAMAEKVEKEEGLGKIYRLACPQYLYKDALKCFDDDARKIVSAKGLIQHRENGKLVRLEDPNGNVVVANPKVSHMVRIFGGWYELDKESLDRQAVVLAAPSKEALGAMALNDEEEADVVARGGALQPLFTFLAMRKEKKLADTANSWRKVGRQTIYRPVALFTPFSEQKDFTDPKEAMDFCVQQFVQNIKPQLKAQNSNVGGVRTTHGPFKVYLTLRPGFPSEQVTVGHREVYFTPGKVVELSTVRIIKKRVMTEAKDDTPQIAFWRKLLSKMY